MVQGGKKLFYFAEETRSTPRRCMNFHEGKNARNLLNLQCEMACFFHTKFVVGIESFCDIETHTQFEWKIGERW